MRHLEELAALNRRQEEEMHQLQGECERMIRERERTLMVEQERAVAVLVQQELEKEATRCR